MTFYFQRRYSILKKSSLTLSILFASMLLTACNTSETSTSNDTANKGNKTEETEETTNSTNVEVTEEEKVEESPNDTEKEQPETNVEIETPTETESKKTIAYTFNNETIEAPTNTVTSEQLGYSIQLPDGFTLTSEEPGSDLVFFTSDSNYSMRVEYYTQADNSYDTLLATVENLMIASTNNNFETLTIEQSAYDIHKGTQFVSVDEASGLQTISAIFEKGDKIIVVTIFDGPENSLKDAFLQMAYSIE